MKKNQSLIHNVSIEVLEILEDGGLTIEQMAEELEYSTNTIKDVVAVLVTADKIKKQGKLYSLKED